MLKKCVGICSKFSVKCEASHKDIVKVDSLMLVTFKYIGRVGTNRKVLHLYVGSYMTKYVLELIYNRNNYRLFFTF